MCRSLSYILLLISLVVIAADDFGKYGMLINSVHSSKMIANGNESQTPVAIGSFCTPPFEEDFNDAESMETSNTTDNFYINKFMLHNVDWADLRMPAPAAIGLMGSLLLSTRQYDPWLTNVKNNTSFSSKQLSSSVVQITKGAFRAFLDAHTSLDSTIRHRFGDLGISEAIHNIVRLLAEADIRFMHAYAAVSTSEINLYYKGLTDRKVCFVYGKLTIAATRLCAEMKTTAVRYQLQNRKEEQIEILSNVTSIREKAAILTDKANYTFYSFNQVQFFFEELHIACVEQSRSDTSFQLTLTIEKLEALATHLTKVVKFFHSLTVLYQKWNTKILNFVRSVETVVRTPANHDRRTIYANSYLALMQEFRANHIAGTYIEISEKYFLPALSDARSLWGIDPSSLQYELAQIHLATFALLTPADIQEIIIKERERFRDGADLVKRKLDLELNILCRK